MNKGISDKILCDGEKDYGYWKYKNKSNVIKTVCYFIYIAFDSISSIPFFILFLLSLDNIIETSVMNFRKIVSTFFFAKCNGLNK